MGADVNGAVGANTAEGVRAFRKGDVVAVQGEIGMVHADGMLRVAINDGDTYCALTYTPSDLTLLRRAPVDLATCELPVEVCDEFGDIWTMKGREGSEAWVRHDRTNLYESVSIHTLRPLDAPAPAPEQWFADAEKTREDCARWCETNGFPDAAPSLRKLYVSSVRAPARDQSDRKVIEQIASGLDGARPCGDPWAFYTDLVNVARKQLGLPEHDTAVWVEPAPDQSDMAAENERLRSALTSLRGYKLQPYELFFDAFVSMQAIATEALTSTAPACDEKGNGSMREAIAKHHATPSDAPACAEMRMTNSEQRAMTDIILSGCELLYEITTCPPGHFLLNGIAVPEPMREAPEVGAEYWFANPPLTAMADGPQCWRGLVGEVMQLRRGLCHLTREAAEIHARALIAASGGSV